MHSAFILKEWDSRFFNRNIFDLNFLDHSDINDWPENALIQKKISAADYLNIDNSIVKEFSLVEGELLFSKKIDGYKIEIDSFCFAEYDDITELKSIVKGLYISSRYRAPWFTENERDLFYQKWIENSVLTTFDDCCLLLKEKNKIIGFVSLRIRNNIATIGLIGVNKLYQGKGVGSRLLKLVENYSAKKLAQKINVATQASNISAAKLYNKNNYYISNIAYWFYKKV